MYFLLDKFDVKWIQTGLVDMNWIANSKNSPNDLFLKHYNVDKYDYYHYILKNCTEIDVQSKYFKVYKP
ncbi:MAG TPA: hypothetical protein DCQ31_10035, partial [Bacteroidales bacterium]|nr:hypothetical protein [Bacteroidales bacterium]